ncbi:Uncharacterised protein [Streptomyces griseus]|nr:Uncharacterised protein [Streptomyces griseus]
MTRSAESSNRALTSVVRYIRSDRKEMPIAPTRSPLYTGAAAHVVPRAYSPRSSESGPAGAESSCRSSSSREVMVRGVRPVSECRER